MNVSWQRIIQGMLICVIAGIPTMALQTPQRSVRDGVYTGPQATRGQTTYRAKCASCHGNALDGRTGPPLAGADFIATWSKEPLAELANKIIRTMPKNPDPRLTPQETGDVLAYMLQANNFPTGNAELAMDETVLKQLRLPAPPAAATAAAATSNVPSLPASGTVAQVMRGILFPSSNIIFTTQTIDPGVKKPPVETTGGMDWLTWGGSVYPGWDVVDYAAISVAESAKLMLTPGRRCENGRPVPVTDPDWIKFTLELEEAGKASYKASQTRIQEKVSDSTNQLNESCMHCHQAYRGRTHCVKP